MRMDCEATREHVDAWALGALDVDEARAFGAHVAGCDACAELASTASGEAAAIALAVPLRAAGSSLKARVIASAAVLSDIGRPRMQRWWAAAAAGLLVAAVGALSWGTVMQTRVNDLNAKNAQVSGQATVQSRELATVRTEIVQDAVTRGDLQRAVESQDAVIDVVSQPDVVRTQLSGTVAAPQATGRYLWSSSEEKGVLVATNLPPPPNGQLFKLWVVYEGGWVSGGTFDTDETGRGRLIVMPQEEGGDADLGRLLGFVVTYEPLINTLATQRSGAMVLHSGLR